MQGTDGIVKQLCEPLDCHEAEFDRVLVYQRSRCKSTEEDVAETVSVCRDLIRRIAATKLRVRSVALTSMSGQKCKGVLY